MVKKSGLKVNNDKTELCLFYRQDTAQVNICIGNIVIKSKSEIIFLSVLFDSQLQWTNHISKVILKADRSLYAIKLIRKFSKAMNCYNC
jgi:hypothetical protein